MKQLFLVFSLWLVTFPAFGFKIKTHVYTANVAMMDLVDGQAYFPGLVSVHKMTPLQRRTLGALLNRNICRPNDLACQRQINKFLNARQIPVENDLLIKAITKYPQFVRAGTVGPDGFPDLVWGQLGPHVNHGREIENSPIHSGIPMKGRDVINTKTWRSVDFGIYLLSKAYGYYPEASVGSADYEHKLRALAFSYGYLLHMSGDANMHSFVNKQAAGIWNYLEGTGIWGTLTEEIKHVSIEDWVDHHLTENVFIEQQYTLDPDKNDRRMPGNNAVVEPYFTSSYTPPSCPDEEIFEERWLYCNPFAGLDTNDLNDLVADPNGTAFTGTHRPQYSCETRKEKPAFWTTAPMKADCDPWKEICYTTDMAKQQRDDFFSKRGKCRDNPNYSPVCRVPDEGWNALVALPTKCDPDAVEILKDGNKVISIQNECIKLNCSYNPDLSVCPMSGILGFKDRKAKAEECVADKSFWENKNNLNSLKTAVPSDFVYHTMAEDPTWKLADFVADKNSPDFMRLRNKPQNETWPDQVRARNFAGPHFAVMLDTRDWFRDNAREWRGGHYHEFVMGAARVFQSGLCIMTFGLWCPKISVPPIFSPALLLAAREQIMVEQTYRYFELSQCIAQNLLNGSTIQGQAFFDDRFTDACMSYDWYKELHYDAAVLAWLHQKFGQPQSSGPSVGNICVNGPAQLTGTPPALPAQINHGSVPANIEKLISYIIFDTYWRVMTPNLEDLGFSHETAQRIRVGTSFASQFMSEYIVPASVKQWFKGKVGGACNTAAMSAIPKVIDLAKTADQMSVGGPNFMVNMAFLESDMAQDPNYARQVLGLLTPNGKCLLVKLLTSSGFADTASKNLFNGMLTPTERNSCTLNSASAEAVLRELSSNNTALNSLKGKKARELESYFLVKDTVKPDGSPGRSEVIVNRSWPVFNTIQLNKLLAFGNNGIQNLENEANNIPGRWLPSSSYDKSPANLPGIRGHMNETGTWSNGYPNPGIPEDDVWCANAKNNLLCNGVPSLDDPDDYVHYKAKPSASTPYVKLAKGVQANKNPTQAPNRSVVLDRVASQKYTETFRIAGRGTVTTTGTMTFNPTNLSVASVTPNMEMGNITRLYGNIFGPYYCNNPKGGINDTDNDSVVDACDNCPMVANEGQQDFNENKIGDVCE